MNCAEVRAALPAILYDELPSAEAAALRDHLAGCPACRAEHAALRRVGTLLTAVPAPTIRVDLSRLYQEAGRRQHVRLRRWRRAALACCAAAAGLLIALGLRLEVRVEGHQAVVRWGTPPAALPDQAPAAAAVLPGPAPAAVNAEEVRLVHQLIHALADDVAYRDRQNQEALGFLETRLDALQHQAQDRWNATERYVSALYTINTNLTRKE